MTHGTVGFLLVGVFAGIVNVVSRIIFNSFLSYDFSVVFAFLIATTVAFTLNRERVFRVSDGDKKKQYVKFVLVNIFALLQVWIISIFFAKIVFPSLDFHFYSNTIAHVIGVASPVFTSYFLYKYIVFRTSSS